MTVEQGRSLAGSSTSPTVNIAGLVRLKTVIDHGGVFQIPFGVNPDELYLRLGYEDGNGCDGDSAYTDNGYLYHDDGDCDQCKGIGNAYVRITVLRSSTPGGPPMAQDLRHFTLALIHPDPRIRSKAANDLAAMGPRAMPAAPALIIALKKDLDPQVREEVAHSLKKVDPKRVFSPEHPKEQIHAWISTLRNAKDARVRVEIAASLGAMGVKHKAVEEALKEALSDKDPRVRQKAARALKRIQKTGQ
jgi:hypothetical protein